MQAGFFVDCFLLYCLKWTVPGLRLILVFQLLNRTCFTRECLIRGCMLCQPDIDM